MGRVLFVAVPEQGHVNPLLAVAQRLVKRGHEIAFFAHGDIGASLAAAGLSVPVFGAPKESLPAERRGAARHDDAAWLSKWFRLCISTVLAQPIRDAVAAAVDAVKPDVMAIDPLAYPGVAVAEKYGIPWAGLSTNFASAASVEWSSPAAQGYAKIASWRADAFASYGITHPVRFNEIMSPWLRIVFATDDLVPDAHDGFFRVGASIPAMSRRDETAFPWERLEGGRALAYVSPGGGQSLSFTGIWDDVVARVAGALDPKTTRIVAVTHRDAAAGLPSWPEHVLPVSYAPQLALLERAAVVVTAGGANTVTESLMAGRPMLVVPVLNDQPLQGALVERAGAGFAVAPRDLDDATCRDRLTRLLREDGPERRRARAIAERYAARDGADEAAALIERLAKTRQPLRSDA